MPASVAGRGDAEQQSTVSPPDPLQFRLFFGGSSVLAGATPARFRATHSRSGSAMPTASRPSPTTKSDPVMRIGLTSRVLATSTAAATEGWTSCGMPSVAAACAITSDCGARRVCPRDDELTNEGRSAVKKARTSLSTLIPRTTVAGTPSTSSRQVSTRAAAAAGYGRHRRRNLDP